MDAQRNWGDLMAWFCNKKERILIFGTGAGGITFYKRCRHRCRVIGFLDNNQQKQGQLLYRHPIYAPKELSQLTFDKIIIASDYHKEMYEQLTKVLAVGEEKIKVFHACSLKHSSWLQRIKEKFELICLELICKRPCWLSSILYSSYGLLHSGNVKLLPFDWLDVCQDFKIHVFRPAIASKTYGPAFINNGAVVEDICLPELALFRFPHGKIKSVSRLVILPNDRVIIERIPTARTQNADYRSASLIFHGESLALIRDEKSISIPRGVLVNGFSETNYYHLMLEVMSQLQFIKELPAAFSDYPILVSAHCQKIPSIKAFLEHANPNKEVIFLNSTESYEVEDLLYINMPNGLVPNLKKDARSDAVNAYFREESIRYIRETAYDICSKNMTEKLPERVFLGRKGNLRAYNQDEIVGTLTPFGFSCINFEEIDFCQQVMIMANAKLIIGPTGAAWTNLVFANPQAKALCWMAEEWGDLSCFSNLAEISGVEMSYLTYKAGTSDSRELYYREYTIPVADVVDWVNHHI